MSWTATLLLTAIAGLGASCVPPARARAADAPANHVKVALLADTTAVVPGKPFTVALKFSIDDDYHIYYLDSGDSGEPPKVKWTLPDGWTVGDLQWPAYQKHDSGAGIDNVYFHEVALLATVTPPAGAKLGTNLTIQGAVRWLVCNPKICLPEKQPVTMDLPIASDASAANEEQFKAWKAAVASAATQPAN